MQKFDPKLYPHLCKLDDKVRALLSSNEARKWDTARTEWEICHVHPVYWMEQYGWIRPGSVEVGGDGSSTKPIQFKLNPIQLQAADRICSHLTGPTFTRVQLTILKHRKAGLSTLVAAFDYWFMRFHGLYAFAIADVSTHTDNIMEMIRLFQSRDTCASGCGDVEKRPPRTVPMPKNKSGMRLSNGTIVEQDTGENSNPGTSGTINVLHMSENSKWRDPENAETSLLNSVPRTGFVFIVKESTAYGLNKFAQDCEDAEKGKSSWEFCFITWLDMPDCCKEVYPSDEDEIKLTTEEREMLATHKKMNLGHIKFMRDQIELLGSASRFRQDFPLNSREPFLVTGSNFFNPTLVRERIDNIKFYGDWKANGIEGLKEKFPDIWERIKCHPRGMAEALTHMEMSCVCPQIVEFWDNGGHVSMSPNPEARLTDGAALMFKYPNKSHKYIVFIDAAEGKASTEYVSDDAVVEVFDCFSLEQVLEWGGTFDEEVTATKGVQIAKVYNNAIIAVEINNKCGGTVLMCIEGEGYKNMFYRETIVANKTKKELGWDTKSSSKKDVLNQLKLDFKNGLVLLHSLTLLEEMMFFLDAQGKLCAAGGHKDDRVMASAGAVRIIAITPSLRKSANTINLFPTELVTSYVSGMRPSRRETIGRYA